MFEFYCSQDESDDAIAGDIRNLGMAKHRFASLRKRLGRFVGKVNAVLATAVWVQTNRPNGSKEFKSAQALLSTLDSHSYLLLSMMADAADELGLLVLWCDKEDMDLASMSSFVTLCLDRLDWLVLQRGLASLAP